MTEQLTAPTSAEPSSEDTGQQVTSKPAPVFRTAAITTVAFLLSAVLTGNAARQTEVRYAGELNADVARLFAPADGVVEWTDVKPGQTVLPGTELFIIRDTQLEERIRKAESRLDGFRIDLAAAEARSELELQHRTAELESAAFETELTLTGLLQQQFQKDFESTALGDYLTLFDALASTEVPPVDLQTLAMPQKTQEYDRLRAMIERSEAENNLDALQTRIELCETRLAELRTAISNLPEKLDVAHKIPVIKASIDTASSELEELESQEAERAIKAPIYGMAGVLRVAERESVARGDLLVEVFDRDREFVNVRLPVSLVAALEAGQHVKLAFPNAEDREGQIDSIPPQLTSATNGTTEAETFSLKIRPVGKPWPTLPIGSSIEVSLD